MSVRFYHELHPDRQEQILCSLTVGDLFTSFKPAMHQLLAMGSYMVLDANRIQALPTDFATYQQEMIEINTGKWEPSYEEDNNQDQA